MSNNTFSLDGLSVSDLAALQAKIDEQIKIKKDETKQEVKAKILALLAEYSFSLSDLFPATKGEKETSSVQKQKVKVKYSDGQNNWTGRGRMPLWVKANIQAGGNLAALEVSK